MKFIRTRRAVATIVVASCIALPASASADPLPSTYKSDAAQSGSAASLASTDRSDAAQSGGDVGSLALTSYSPARFKGGDSAQPARTAAVHSVKDPRQADMHASTVKKPTFPPAAFRGGDTPVDHPGASRAPSATPTTIEIVRPERTIVRDVDEALPLILSSTALLLVLAGLGMTLIRTRMLPRPGASR
jgi:hypothetical protein